MTQSDISTMKGSASKALIVLSQVIENGPTTPAKIGQHTGLSQQAVYRALDLLRRQGWVMGRLGNGGYIASFEFENLVSNAQYSDPIVDRVRDDIIRIGKEYGLYVDFYGFIGGAEFDIVESSDPNLRTGALSLDVSDVGVIAVCMALGLARTAKLISQRISNGLTHESDASEMVQRMKAARANDCQVVDTDYNLLAVPYQDAEGNVGSVQLRLRKQESNNFDMLLKASREAQKALSKAEVQCQGF